MKRLLPAALTVLFSLALAACGGAGPGAGKPKSDTPEAKGPALLIAAEDLHTVRSSALASGPSITGTVQPERRADLRSEVSAIVLQALKENGDAVRRGDLLLTVSTGGRSPGLASWTRTRLEAEFGPEWATLLDLLADARDELRATGRSSLGVDWHAALDSGMLELVREGRLAEAKERLQACLSSSSD